MTSNRQRRGLDGRQSVGSETLNLTKFLVFLNLVTRREADKVSAGCSALLFQPGHWPVRQANIYCSINNPKVANKSALLCNPDLVVHTFGGEAINYKDFKAMIEEDVTINNCWRTLCQGISSSHFNSKLKFTTKMSF